METLTSTQSIAETVAFNWFRDKVNYHYSQAKKLHKFKKYEKVPDLLTDVAETEIEILKSFGLPEAYEFTSIIDIFSWREEINDSDIRELFVTLKETAADYLLSPAMTSRETLIEAKETHQTACGFFPIIGIDRNEYNIFLYETLFYTKDYDVEVILQELHKGNTISEGILTMFDTPMLIKGGLNEQLEKLGLKYWREFVEQEKNEKKTPNRKTIRQLDMFRYDTFRIFPKTVTLNEGYISSIKYFEAERPYVLVEIVTSPIDRNTINIHVYMSFDEVIKLLKKSTNHSISSNIRSMLLENFIKNREYTNQIQIREWHKTYLYCKGIDMLVKKSNLSVNDIGADMLNFYELNNFNENLFF